MSHTLEIPASHMDLLQKPLCCALSTLMPDGAPQTTVVWFEYDGCDIYINTMRGFRKARNMRRNPRVTLLVYEPERPSRFLELRGRVVEMTEEGAEAHLDRLSEFYTGYSPYFGRLVARELRGIEIPVKCRIELDHFVAKVA